MCQRPADMESGPKEAPQLGGGDTASLFSRLFVLWGTPIAWRGTKRPLKESELPPPPALLCGLRAEAERLWAAELAAAPTTRPNGKPNIIKGVCFPIAKEALVLGYVLNIVSGGFTTIVRPLLSKFLIQALRSDSEMSTEGGWALAGALAATVFMERWTTVQGSLYAGDEGPLRIVTALTHLVAKKTIELQVGAGKEGFETALLGNDLVRGSEMAKIFPLLPLGISCLVGGVGMLLYIGGAATLIGVGAMFVLLFVTMKLGLKSKYAQAAYQVRRTSLVSPSHLHRTPPCTSVACPASASPAPPPCPRRALTRRST